MISGPVCLNQASDDQSSSMCNLLTYPFLLITFTTNYHIIVDCEVPSTHSFSLCYFCDSVACIRKSLAKVARG